MSNQPNLDDHNPPKEGSDQDSSISEDELALLFDDSENFFADDFNPAIFTDAPAPSQADTAPVSSEPAEGKTLSQSEIDALLASMRQDDD